MSILGLRWCIASKLALRLTQEGRFLRATEDLVGACLMKGPKVRKILKQPLVSAFSGLQWGVALANSLVVKYCHGWSIPGHSTLTWRLGHPMF